MKSNKSYTCKISGNQNKIKYLEQTLSTLQELSDFVFVLGRTYGQQFWSDQKNLYKTCRKLFPNLNSKILQNFISLYQPKGKRKLPKYQPIQAGIFVDQGQNFKIDSSTKLTNFWIRFSRRNFPLLGKRILKKIKDPEKVKLIQIFKRKHQLYCKISYVNEIPEPTKTSKVVGLDVNTKRIVLSNNKFYHMKKLFHKKIEHHKNNQKKRSTNNFTKDFLHKLTTQISKDLSNQGVEVLVLENLKSLRKSASRKLGTSKGRKLNYIINSMSYGMFQDFLSYKCLDLGIQVQKINPAYTSKTCSNCKSRNTSRPRQVEFICNNCNLKLDADLNGSRNIEMFYKTSQWATSDSSPRLGPKLVGSPGL